MWSILPMRFELVLQLYGRSCDIACGPTSGRPTRFRPRWRDEAGRDSGETQRWAELDTVELNDWMLRRVPMSKTCPRFMRGRFRQCWGTALRERCRARLAGDVVSESRAWKLFCLVPVAETSWHRELPISREAGGSSCWTLHPRSLQRDPVRLPSQRRKSRNGEGLAAQSRIQRGQVSRARQELTGVALAPKSEETLQEMRRQRPEVQVRPIPPAVLEFEPDTPLRWIERFSILAQGAPSGVAPGPGGCTNAMLHTCLDDAETLSLLLQTAEDFARGHVPDDVCRALMLATMTGLQKRDGGVRSPREHLSADSRSVSICSLHESRHRLCWSCRQSRHRVESTVNGPLH